MNVSYTETGLYTRFISLSLFLYVSLSHTHTRAHVHTQSLLFPQPTVVTAILPSHAQTGAQGPRAAFDRHYR